MASPLVLFYFLGSDSRFVGVVAIIVSFRFAVLFLRSVGFIR